MTRRRWIRCSIASESTISPSQGAGEPAGRISVDCVVVGGGISGLCTAQALITRHSSAVGEVLVTEARGRVGGNITTVERDGYLWEEGPNSFQPSDPVLSMAVCFHCPLVLGSRICLILLSEMMGIVRRWTVD